MTDLLPMALRPRTRIRITIPWPRHPETTPTGRISKAKGAGKPIPWLSHNTINRLEGGGFTAGKRTAPRFGQSQPLKVAWREAARAAVKDGFCMTLEVELELHLYRYGSAARAMDPAALVEGAKPIVDGMVLAGFLGGDGSAFVRYSQASSVSRCGKGEERVELIVRPAEIGPTTQVTEAEDEGR